MGDAGPVWRHGLLEWVTIHTYGLYYSGFKKFILHGDQYVCTKFLVVHSTGAGLF
jgi:hypothetical protein